MRFRCISQSWCVQKILILRDAVPVGVRRTAFLQTHFLFFMFFVQCLKLTFYVCLCTSVFVSAYADVSTSESATLSQIGLFVYDRATISLSNSQRKVLTLHAPHG